MRWLGFNKRWDGLLWRFDGGSDALSLNPLKPTVLNKNRTFNLFFEIWILESIQSTSIPSVNETSSLLGFSTLESSSSSSSFSSLINLRCEYSWNILLYLFRLIWLLNCYFLCSINHFLFSLIIELMFGSSDGSLPFSLSNRMTLPWFQKKFFFYIVIAPSSSSSMTLGRFCLEDFFFYFCCLWKEVYPCVGLWGLGGPLDAWSDLWIWRRTHRRPYIWQTHVRWALVGLPSCSLINLSFQYSWNILLYSIMLWDPLIDRITYLIRSYSRTWLGDHERVLCGAHCSDVHDAAGVKHFVMWIGSVCGFD